MIAVIFPLLVGVLEFAAGCVYAYQRQWWLALTWVAYAVACVGLAMAAR